jgi:acetyltransferase-like isoleucine patch superfamily enzyme/dTDP-4-dehydrorhamnose 3,5-epimerase-like enzyme
MSAPFIHPNALCETSMVGEDTRVWAFAHILPRAQIGRECNICDGVFIENDVRIGNRVTIKCGVQLWDGVTVEDDVFIGPNATFTNDLFPRSKVHLEHYAETIIRAGASIGANATLLSGIEIGTRAMVGAGAVVTKSVPPNAIVVGNPARIMGYVQEGTRSEALSLAAPSGNADSFKTDLGVGGAALYNLKSVRDMRGDLSVGEFERDLPFAPKRYFLVYGVPSQEVRGEHAHKKCHQFLICVKGSCQILVDDGSNRREVILDRPNLGVHMPPMIWGTQYRYSNDAVLLVFASHYYESDDYIRTYVDFLDAASR